MRPLPKSTATLSPHSASRDGHPRRARYPEIGGVTLRELAGRFDRTVERLTHLLEALRRSHARELRAEAEKKGFYREVLRSVTNGHLELVEPEDLPRLEMTFVELTVQDPESYAVARAAVQQAAREAGMGEERAADLVLAAGEALGNAIRHARDAHLTVGRREGRLMLRISDAGPGIRPADLPAAILTNGSSSTTSLGLGFELMMRLSQRMWLSTGPEGTVIVLE